MIIEGIRCDDKSVAQTGINKGEMYMAKRNTGWKLLECRWYDKDNCIVHPVRGTGYSFDSWECFKVMEE